LGYTGASSVVDVFLVLADCWSSQSTEEEWQVLSESSRNLDLISKIKVTTGKHCIPPNSEESRNSVGRLQKNSATHGKLWSLDIISTKGIPEISWEETTKGIRTQLVTLTFW